MRRQVMMGVERRRRWSDEQKLRVLSEVGIDGASAAEIVRRHDITGSTSTSGAAICVAGARFIDAGDIPACPACLRRQQRVRRHAARSGTRPSLVEISLRNGRSIRAAANLPAPQLRA